MSMDAVAALRKTELFRDLDDALLRALAERAVERRLTRGEILFMIGDSAN
jgi:CRP-like cAMP-binding protein